MRIYVRIRSCMISHFKYTYLVSPAYTIADVTFWADDLSLDYRITYEEVIRYHDDEPMLECYFQTNDEDAAILFKLTWII